MTAGSRSPAARPLILEVRGLAKSFTLHQSGKRIAAVEGVDFHVRAGEFVGLTGKSGSGKSTVLKCIYRTYLPLAGTIRYESAMYGSIDLARAPERAVIALRRHEIGYVSQFLTAMPRTTARELVEEAIVEAGRDLQTAAAEAEWILNHFELEKELWDNYPATFSGGEKLRLNIARAMVKRPRLLLLDEPTASLDDGSKRKVRELIEQLMNEGTTMLGIFHDLAFMHHLCTREYSITNGQFVLQPNS